MMQIVSDEEELEPKVEKGERIRLGMFPELLVITDECFNAAEWQGEEKF